MPKEVKKAILTPMQTLPRHRPPRARAEPGARQTWVLNIFNYLEPPSVHENH